MTRRYLLLLAAAGAMIGIAALALQQKPTLLQLDWALKAKPETPPVAVLIEMGLKDTEPTPWSGKATVSGAKVVKREGYRFREEDKLVDPDAWEVTSHRPIRLPRGNPALARLEGMPTVGVVLHLSDVKGDAALTLEPKPQAEAKVPEKVTVALKDVLAGKATPIWDGAATIRLITTATPLAGGKTEDDFPAAAYGPNGILWVAYISYTNRDDSRRIEQPQYMEQPADFKALNKPEFADQLFVQYYRDGSWSKPAAVTGPSEDLVRCAIAVQPDGDALVAYSANRKGNYDIYVRSLSLNTPEAVKNPTPRMGNEQRISSDPGPDLTPVFCTDQNGQLRLAWQTGQNGRFDVEHVTLQNGRVTGSGAIAGGGNRWHPAITAGPKGEVALAYDMYRDGDYDVIVEVFERAPKTYVVASSSKFETRPSVCYDVKGRLWVAYEEGPEKWGKDYGALDADDGNPLYNERSVRVVCIEDGKLTKPAAELPTSTVAYPKIPFEALTSPRYERGSRYSAPKLGLDGKGRVWLCYREKFGTRYSSHAGSYWLSFVRRLDGDKWTEPIEIHHSDSLMDYRPVLLPHVSGGLVILHNTDGRITTPEAIDNQVYASHVTLPGDPVEPKLVPHEAGTKDGKAQAAQAEELAAVKRIRDYRIETGGKKLQLLRGEFHRHTEVSWDGGPDGSLEDMFRYAIDAAAMDWIGNGDHDNGAGREYTWWLTQKLTDAYSLKTAFTPMFTYERSVSYPHGHRNCMFAQRGVMTLPRLAEPDMAKRVGGVHADDAKMLFRYLKEHNGICAGHTAATGMGTDWRDNDPVVEPFVEIYQGDRMSYEYEGAPRSGYDPQSGKLPAQIGGWQPLGFLNLAFKKGYRLGFQASSDHWSTHISYCIAAAERHDREAILDAFKKRHCYGATDNIIVDVRSGNYMMGDEFKTNQPPSLQFTVIGTKAIAQIDILKDSEVVETIKPGAQEHKGTWTDPKPTPGTHYYYIRVLQTDNEIAWASPMWIEFGK